MHILKHEYWKCLMALKHRQKMGEYFGRFSASFEMLGKLLI